MGKRILIKGNILITTTSFDFKNATCLWPENEDVDFDEIIDGNLTIDEKFDDRITTHYFATGGISALYIGTGNQMKGIYHEASSEISIIKELLKNYVPRHVFEKETFFRMLYINAISTMESFTTNIFRHLVLNHESFFSSFQTNSSLKKRIGKENPKESADEIITKAFFNDFRSLYNNIIGIDYLDMTNINNFINVRNDLVHRIGYTRQHEKIELTETEILGVVDEIDKFIDDLMEKTYYLIYSKTST